MDSVGKAVEQGPGEALGTEDLGPALKGKIGSDYQTLAFVGPADYLEEEFRSYLGKRHISQFVQDQKLLAFELFVEALEGPIFSALQKLGDQTGNAGETDTVALHACRECQGTCEMRLAGTTVADEQDVFTLVYEFTPQVVP